MGWLLDKRDDRQQHDRSVEQAIERDFEDLPGSYLRSLTDGDLHQHPLSKAAVLWYRRSSMMSKSWVEEPERDLCYAEQRNYSN